MNTEMETKKRDRYVLVDALFASLLIAALVLDWVVGHWHRPHGVFFVCGLGCLVGIVVAGLASMRRVFMTILPALVSLALLPAFEIAGGGSPGRLVAFLALVSSAFYFSARTIVKQDRFQGVCGLLLTLWALAIGFFNALSAHQSVGFWTAEWI